MLDLLLGGGSGVISLKPGHGDGTFGQEIAHLHGHPEPFVAFGNFNGDDNLDFAFVGGLYAINEHAHIVLANGDGTFSKVGRYGKLTPYSHPTIIADLNRDGSLDFAILDAPGKVLLGNGDGSFQPQIRFDAFGGWALVAADFDRDGNLDLAGFGQDGSNAAIGLMLGNGDGTFQQPVIVMSGTKLGGTTLQVSDLNGDGKADLVFIAAHVGVGILFGNGDGTFQTRHM